MISYEHFKKVFDDRIFSNSKADLVNKLATDPDRFVGIYRSTSPQEKIAQNLSQSHEIRFGDAFEQIIQDVLLQVGFSKLDKRIQDSAGNTLSIDQLVRASDGEVIFIEQKVRDDHDSTKKKGQAENFRLKILALQSLYRKDLKRAFVFFIDPSRKKNKNFYVQKATEFEVETGVECFVFYGADLFEQIGMGTEWNILLEHLTRWRSELEPLPSVNFDENPSDSAVEILINVSKSRLKKLFADDRIVKEILPVIFPTKDTLKILLQEYESQADPAAISLVQELRKYLNS